MKGGTDRSSSGKGLPRIGLVVFIAAMGLISVSNAVGASAVQLQGYIPMSDGAQLEYTVDLPGASGQYPVAMVYDGYCEGIGPLACNDPYSAAALLKAGFAVLGVSIEGTSCSTGTFNAFSTQESIDGAEVVEWAARQPWSNGHIGMFGDSFPGITQLGVAGLHPPHLDAIAPFQVVTDLYQDAAFPGGMANVGFGALWGGFDQPYNSSRSGLDQALSTKNTGCVTAQLHDVAAEPANNIALQGLMHPYEDSFWEAHDPGSNAASINIPVLGCVTWQDDEVGSLGATYLSGLNPTSTWVIGSNGYHGMCELNSPYITTELVAFFNRFVKGAPNGFEHFPHIVLWHDTHRNGAGDNVPSWITTFNSFSSMAVQPVSLFFEPGGSLSVNPPTGGSSPSNYVYPGPNLGTEDGVVVGQHNILWNAQDLPGTSLSYTTPPLTHDTEFYGSGSVNLWLSSTAPDTDLEVTLTEVRPDGQEQYITRGWLRAEDRAIDPTTTTDLAPGHTFEQAATQPLVPGQPTYMRLQLEPFDYVFRQGSSIRLWIDAPTGLTGSWLLDFLNTPAINSVFASAQHPSAVVLGYLPGGRAGAALSACDTILNQPCRKNRVPAPAGAMTIK
jgi:hypothetical protein